MPIATTPTQAGATLTNTVNYSGLFFSMTDDETRFLDAVQARGRGRTITNSDEFILANTYKHRDPKQPNITEKESLRAPDPRTTPREQASNVVQIFHESIEISFAKQANFGALSGVNLANATNPRPNEFDTQMEHTVTEMRRDLNYTMLQGQYAYTPLDPNAPRKTRGILQGIETNRFDFTGVEFNDLEINRVIMRAIKNGFQTDNVEIWCNPEVQLQLTNIFSLLPGAGLPASRNVGGIAYDTIVTNFGTFIIHWEPLLKEDQLLFANMSQLAVCEKSYFNAQGENLGVFFAYDLARLGAGERSAIYGEVGCDYGAENKHILVENIDFEVTP